MFLLVVRIQKRVHGFGLNVACRHMSGLGTWTNYLTLSPIRIIVRMLEPDCFLRYRISAAMRNFTAGKSHWPLHRAVVLKWFYSLSYRKTFVRGKCALPSALLVLSVSLFVNTACSQSPAGFWSFVYISE